MTPGRFQDLPRRIRLTLEYEGLSGFARKTARFLIRLTPLRRLVPADAEAHERMRRARRWYRSHGRPVTVIVPTYGDPAFTIRTVQSVERTTDAKRVRIVVTDDGSPRHLQGQLAAELDCELVLGDANLGFAGNVNRTMNREARAGSDDLVLLNNDVTAHQGWLEALQEAAYRSGQTGIAGPKLLYPDRRIQSAGSYRNLGAPEWFDHRYRFRAPGYGPAGVPAPCIAVTGACMYVKRSTLTELGGLDVGFGMAFEDVDYCLRAWRAGHRVLYAPDSVLTHHESSSRGTAQGARELGSLAYFWDKWGDFLDTRSVRTGTGSLRITYVTQDTGVGGGHRNIFEQINMLAERGHEVSLYSLGGAPDWFDLHAPVKQFEDYDELVADLSERNTIKVATWWETAKPVWLASVSRGIPVFLVQDIETSYYPDSPRSRDAVLAGYREEFAYMTISEWNADRLRELGLSPTLMPCGVDRATFHPLPGIERESGVILAVGRSLHLKNLGLTVDAWRALPEPRPELWLFGIEPELGDRYGARYFERPTDAEVNELLNRATVFVQTSIHEGFCLPVLEAMAAGTPTVTTDAHGNRGWCVDDFNCLMPASDVESVSSALSRMLSSAPLRERIRARGLESAAEYDQERQADRLEAFFGSLAARHERSKRLAAA